MSPDISVIVPVYNEQSHTLHALVAEVHRVLTTLQITYELLFVDDGGKHETNMVLRDIVANNSNCKLVVLSRNFGEQAAICAGLRHCSGLVSVNLDSDLQDPPALIEQMLQAWQNGFDVVLAKQSVRHEPISKTFPSAVFYRVLNFLADRPIPVDVGEFRLLSRPVIDAINQMPERIRFMREMVPWMGFKQMELPFVRADRASGESGYNTIKLLKLAFQAVLVSSTKPLFLMTPVALTIMIIGVAALALTTYFPKYIVLSTNQLACLNLIFCSFILLALGLVAPYIARIIGEVRARPLFIVSELVGFATIPATNPRKKFADRQSGTIASSI
jgi:polyisoprenyl-phosphate glycosyltransferase